MMTWWQTSAFYHIYPRSFQDADGDGVGDLRGIIHRLDYLQWLGIGAIWLSPIYPSPMADFGYDISDHTAIHPLFGTLADMDDLIAAVHERGMRIILDFVPNHTSDEHPWFIESRASRDNPKRDWYYWRDPAPDGGPPNNWLSRFGGESAWEWDETTGQYYLHLFLKKQPDLNWRNPAVRQAMFDVLRFWLERGVDGFRVDVPYRVMKAEGLPDNPRNPDWQAGMDPAHRLSEQYTRNYSDSHDFNRWLREVIDTFDERVLVGEMNLPIAQAVKHYGTPQKPEFHLPFNVALIFSDWNAANVRRLADAYYASLPDFGWPNWVLSNHDQPRFAARAGQAQARNGLLFLLTMPGTPTIYYGDELGMTNVEIPPERVQDPWELLAPGIGVGRDPMRTPMQWRDEPHAGFSPVEPWLPVAADYATVNVAHQQADPQSVLTLARRLLTLRRQEPVLLRGDYKSLPAPSAVFAYQRQAGDQTAVVLLNFSDEVQTTDLPADAPPLMLSTRLDDGPIIDGGTVSLRPHEGVLLVG